MALTLPCSGSRLDPAAARSSKPRVQEIPQGVAQHVKAEDRGADGEPRPDDHPRRLVHVLPARAASMYWFSFTDRVALRITREARKATPRASTKITFHRPGPITEMMVMRMSSPGKAIQVSTSRWVSMSTLPP